MAKEKAAPKDVAEKKATGANVPATTKGAKAPAVSLTEMAGLLAKQIELEGEERAKSGQTGVFISIAQGNTKMLKPKDPSYVPGLSLYDFVIPSKKLVLGKELTVTVLAICKVYAEVTPKDNDANDSAMDQTRAYWLPEDAELVPESEPFNRPLPNGNVLRPQHWIYVRLHDHPEIEGALFGLRSIGNKVYTQLNKIIKSSSTSCTELRFKVTQQEIVATGGQANYYPMFEIDGRNFAIDEDTGVPQKIKGGMSEAEIVETITASAQIFEDYKNAKVVSRHALPANGFTPKALPGYAEDTESETAAPAGKKPRF